MNFTALLYPLGFLAQLLFGGRFFIQWMQSERQGKSLFSLLFWRLSLAAHLLMALHGYLQGQYPVLFFQTLNACIAWRLLNLQRRSLSLSRALILVSLLLLLVSLLFFIHYPSTWMHAPLLPWNQSQTEESVPESLSWIWHGFGALGMALFASRFWIYWWTAERHKQSKRLTACFWWSSLIGALSALIYSIRLKDPVNIFCYSLGCLPYIRNLMLLKKQAPPSSPVSAPPASLFFFAGEQSGDQLGGPLIAALKQKRPELQIRGVGGEKMHHAGMEPFLSLEAFRVMGFSAVVRALPRLVRLFHQIKKEILQTQPAAVVFIDYPDFTMRLAKALRKKGFQGKLIHYVVPSVWAWRKKRIKSLEATLDLLLAILPFEPAYFEKSSLPVTYVGHPLVKQIEKEELGTPFLSFVSSKKILALFPGSRPEIIRKNLPLQYEAALPFSSEYTLALSVAHPSLQPLIISLLKKKEDAGFPSPLLVPAEARFTLMRTASAAFATSGTIVLELGLHRVPTLVTYKLSLLNSVLARFLFRLQLPFYSLVNLICQEEVYPEFIHYHISPTALSHALPALLQRRSQIEAQCRRLRQLLICSSPSEQAAHSILHLILKKKYNIH